MNVIICGYKGKIGTLLHKKINNTPNIKLVGVVDKNTKPLEDILKNKEVDLVIDFTNAQTCLKHANLCLINNINFLSGTTGISKNDLRYIDKCAKHKGLSFIIAPNFSLGINAILKIIPFMSSCFDNIEIEEQHHISKIDKPSGTALEILNYSKNKNIKIKSIRNHKRNIYHKITFKHNEETITIIHQTNSRKVYIDGIIYAINMIGTFKGLKRTIKF